MTAYQAALFNSGLTSLEISFNGCQDNVTSEHFKCLAGGLPKVLRVLSFDFTCCEQFDDDVMNVFASALGELTNLSRLSLNFGECVQLTDGGCRALARALRTLDKLEDANLDFNGVEQLDEGT